MQHELLPLPAPLEPATPELDDVYFAAISGRIGGRAGSAAPALAGVA